MVALMRLLDIAVGVMLVSLMAFIWMYFGTGRKWLALAVPVFYAIGLAFDYLPWAPTGSGMTYQRFTGFRTVETFGGASFHVAEGVPNPWNVFPYLAVLAQIVFVADASVRLRRNTGDRRAMVVGGATASDVPCLSEAPSCSSFWAAACKPPWWKPESSIHPT